MIATPAATELDKFSSTLHKHFKSDDEKLNKFKQYIGREIAVTFKGQPERESDFRTLLREVTGYDHGERTVDTIRALSAGQKASTKLAFAIYLLCKKHPSYEFIAVECDKILFERKTFLTACKWEPEKHLIEPKQQSTASKIDKHLEPCGEVTERRAKSPRAEISEIKGQPKLSLFLTKISDETRFLYRSRAIPFINDRQAFDQLERFRKFENSFCWHLIYGLGGTGKSRMALEYAIERESLDGNPIGFLSLDDAKGFDWLNWQPSKPTFLIVDYAARYADTVATIMRTLSLRNDIKKKARLLLLERDPTGTWFDKITHRGKSENVKIDETWFPEDGALEPPDDVWPIIEHICGDAPERLPAKDNVLTELERIDHHCRPLYAAFLGDAYRRGENPRNWDAYALVENVLQHEKRYWNQGSIDHLDVNLCACATTTGGFPSKWVEQMSTHEMQSFWPVWSGNQTLERLASVYGDSIVDDVPPLEPDILGEVFVLDYWKSASRFERRHLLDFATTLAPWFAEFIERMASDFPCEAAFDLLRKVVDLDFQEYQNSKPELIFNIVTALAKHHPEYAMECFWFFKRMQPNENALYVAECIIDGGLNLIVGVHELDLKDALEIYEFQKSFVSKLPASLEIDRAQCELASSLIAIYPLEDPSLFRPVLADTFKSMRRNQSDQEIRGNTCIAISNFVNLLEFEHIGHASYLLHLFRREAPSSSIEDSHGAWLLILYHMFLLFLVEHGGVDDTTDQGFKSAFGKLAEQAPEAERFKDEILKRFQEDLKE